MEYYLLIDYEKYKHRPPLEHQKIAIEKLVGSTRFILADDMGLGKTVQALSCLQLFKENAVKMKALVVCPTTLMFNWENEIKKFTPKLTYKIHHGGERERDKKLFESFIED